MGVLWLFYLPPNSSKYMVVFPDCILLDHLLLQRGGSRGHDIFRVWPSVFLLDVLHPLQNLFRHFRFFVFGVRFIFSKPKLILLGFVVLQDCGDSLLVLGNRDGWFFNIKLYFITLRFIFQLSDFDIILFLLRFGSLFRLFIFVH